MKVFLDEEENYTVSGYHDRMKRSIGEIYLGLDRGPQYDRLSEKTNAAIRAISERDAFELARSYTNKILVDGIVDDNKLRVPGFISATKLQAAAIGQRAWELNLDVKEVTDLVLASLCQDWFGMPKEWYGAPAPKDAPFKVGGQRWDWKPSDPSLYPGNFTAPSRYLFQPRPGETAEKYGCDYGKSLTKAMGELVKRHRDQNTKPDGAIAQVIFDAFPDRSEGDLVARTMVGALMGFLPTVDGNLRLSLNEWLRDGTFWALRAALAADPAEPGKEYEKAIDLLRAPLVQAMQLRPSPELVWRKATCHHTLGKRKVPVEPNDTVVVSIVSATQQCLAQNDPDIYAVFGGNRSQSVHPTHACPAYAAGMGVLLGVAYGLLEVEESMRASPVPLALTFTGVLPPASDSQAHDREERATALAPRAKNSELSVPAELVAKALSPGRLIAEGDSWFCGLLGVDLVDMLEEQGYTVESVARPGDGLEDMIRAAQLAEFCRTLERRLILNDPPKAVLLSAGGNDVVRDNLKKLLKPSTAAKPIPADKAIDSKKARQVIDRHMRDEMVKIFSAISQVCSKNSFAPIPILVHGYDYPIPDGRSLTGVPKNPLSWLYPALTAMGYADLEAGKNIMRQLIDRLNKMLAGIADLPGLGHVKHVDLRGTLSSSPEDYQRFWANELHPTADGFRLLCDRMVQVIEAAKPKRPEPSDPTEPGVTTTTKPVMRCPYSRGGEGAGRLLSASPPDES
jgi:lysophospholipase L1-like esterase